MKIEIFIPIITAVTGSIITWLFTRKRSEAETLKIELENVHSVIKLWQKIAEDLGKKVAELTTENELLRKEMSELKTELKRFQHIINTINS